MKLYWVAHRIKTGDAMGVALRNNAELPTKNANYNAN